MAFAVEGVGGALQWLAKSLGFVYLRRLAWLGGRLGLMSHKCRGTIIVLSISKSVEPNEEQKEMISSFQQGILCKH